MTLWDALCLDSSLRRKREREFGRLHEAQWNILTDLARARITLSKVSVTSACIASRHPPTTALAHIGRLEAKGLIRRKADEADARRFWLHITDTGFEAVNAAFGFEPFALARVA